MNQIKIGKFISSTRKSKKLTQVQLADALNISDKTVSKWECGNGLPDVSLMLPLCERLDISVNDLLSGEKIGESDYQTKAENNMIHLMKENEESKKKFVLSIINGTITIIAVASLMFLASFPEIPIVMRVVLIACALLSAVFGIAGTATLDREAGVFECPYCKELFVPSMGDYIKGCHTFTKRKLVCPKCEKRGMCRHKIRK